jgi:hypothetical protein
MQQAPERSRRPSLTEAQNEYRQRQGDRGYDASMRQLTADELAENAYLWDGSEPGWVLLRDRTGHLLPINERTRMSLITVMLARGVRVVDTVPQGPRGG